MPPLLVELCCRRMAAILSEDFSTHSQVLDLPLDLLRRVLRELPPLALHYLEEKSVGLIEYDELFSTAWEYLVKRDYHGLLIQHTWKSAYWEAHVQNCLNTITAEISVPNFESQIGEILLPEPLISRIGATIDACCHESDFKSLKATVPVLAKYVKSLRLRNVLCSSDLLDILDQAELAELSFYNIKTTSKIISRNLGFLRRLKFHYCKFSEIDFNCLADMLKSSEHLNDFAIFCSTIQVVSASSEMPEFLRSCRNLSSIHLVSNRMHTQFTSSIMVELFSLSSLHFLDVADNLLESCFASPALNKFFMDCSAQQSAIVSRLKVLDLKLCFLSSACVQNLVHYLRCLPHLETLNLSDNPVADEGIKSLAGCLQTSLSALKELNVASCEFSCSGLSSLLDSLVSAGHVLNYLSVADNNFGNGGSILLARYLQRSTVKELDIAEIGLGPRGCSSELTSALILNGSLECLNISKNRIGFAGAELLHSVISQNQAALTEINASFNLLNIECMKLIASALQTKFAQNGTMRRLDLQGNPGVPPPGINLFGSFSDGPDPVVLISGSQSYVQLHDDDP